MVFKGKGREKTHIFTMDVDPGYKNIDKFTGGFQWYLTSSNVFISNIIFKLKIENEN